MKILIVRKLAAISIIYIMLISFCLSVNAINDNFIIQNSQALSNSVSFIDYTDITVEEAWNLLNDTSNGIQIPIDVRTDNEWRSDHINTPKPENPRHHNFFDWDDEQILMNFMNLYNGKEIIVYCASGSRSISAINILIDNGYNGIIYNMLGGITEWKNAGLPTIPNQPPEDPEILGTINGRAGEDYEYIFISTDPENDELYYFINWSDNSTEDWIGPYTSNEDVKLTHNWAERGAYLIQAKVKDKYGDESNWTTLEISMPKSISSYNNISIEIHGGLGFTIIITNNGDTDIPGLEVTVTMDAPWIMLVSERSFTSYIDLISGTEVSITTGFLLGFSPFELTINILDITETRNGFILGPFVILY